MNKKAMRVKQSGIGMKAESAHEKFFFLSFPRVLPTNRLVSLLALAFSSVVSRISLVVVRVHIE